MTVDLTSPVSREGGNGEAFDPSNPSIQTTGSVPGAEQLRIVAKVAVVIMAVGIALNALQILVFFLLKGAFFGVGAVEGGALVVLDLWIFKKFAADSRPGRLQKPLWVTIVKFYLVSLANIAVCFLVLKFKLGHPLSFIAGLGTFLPALTVGVIAFFIYAKDKPSAGQSSGGRR
ncbi:MAG: hypothetical protein LBJ64_12785 [Deltaproteobacteria bacterium]|jgi:hypothetical protein|nr:hypothetical protein [Deltaproteobacteria bacterium]